MKYILPIFLGFMIAAIGILPPGIINMTAVKIKLDEGKIKAQYFIVGALVIIFFQTYIALIFAKQLTSQPNIIRTLQQIGVLVFFSISIYLFYSAKRKPNLSSIKRKSNFDIFNKGMLVSAINMFPIPYYVFSSVTLAAYQLFYYEPYYIYCFIIGVLWGSYLIFYLYTIVFKQKENNSSFFQKNGNYIIGSVTGIIAFITLIKLIM